MAEASAARDKPPPTGVAAARDGFAQPVDQGQPIADVPPLVEFGDSFEAAESGPPPSAERAPAAPDSEPSAPPPIQRPPRRSFLAPVTASSEEPSLPHRPARPPGRLLSKAAAEPTAAVRVVPEPPARTRRWPRRLGVGVGLAAALALAVAAQLGVGGDWIDWLRLATLDYQIGRASCRERV